MIIWDFGSFGLGLMDHISYDYSANEGAKIKKNNNNQLVGSTHPDLPQPAD